MRILLLLFLWFGLLQADLVVCVHGFLRSKRSMAPLVRALGEDGHTVLNWGYPSRSGTIEEHAEHLVADLQGQEQPIHFVTHSMGALVVRAALNHPKCPTARSAVLLAPPNGGSAFGRRIGRYRLIRWIVGPHAGRQLTTLENFDHLGTFPDEMRVLVIAGERDGKVAVGETALPTPHQHVVIPATHPWIMRNKKAISRACAFLKDT